MRDGGSPLPIAVKWIPNVINFLDDAQDLLYTALVLGKWLAPRVFLRLAPGLGWVLLANDLLNVSTGLLGVALASRSMKRGMLETLELLGTNRARRLGKVAAFMEKTPIIPFLLQAGQASTTLTGYGLSLGAAMGMVTDSIWSAIRAVQGAQITIKGPPPADPLGKAARFLTQSPQQVFMQDIISPEDHELLIAAHAVATTIIQEGTTPANLESRHDLQFSTRLPSFEVWNEKSRCALKKEGITWDATINTEQRPYILTAEEHPTLADIHNLTAANIQTWQSAMGELFKQTSKGTVLNTIYNQANLDNWRWIASDPKNIEPIWEPWEQAAAAAVEFSVFPNGDPKPEDVLTWLETANRLAADQGFTRASFESLKAAATYVLGGYQRKRYETLDLPPTLYKWPDIPSRLWATTICATQTPLEFHPDSFRAWQAIPRWQEIHPDQEICYKNLKTGTQYPASEIPS